MSNFCNSAMPEVMDIPIRLLLEMRTDRYIHNINKIHAVTITLV